MTTGGWISMILSVGTVTVLFVWCLYKVLAHNPPAENILEDSLKDIEPSKKD
jgi:hypothetical protein